MKPGDLVRDRQLRYISGSYYREYNYEWGWDFYKEEPEKRWQSPPAVFIKWHMVDGEEDGEFYSCAKVLKADGSVGNILRDNLEVISGR